MIKIYISGNRADVIEREPLTSGTVGKVLNFAFTEDWRLLIKYAVFEGSGRRIALTNIGDSCIIPHEVLAKHGGALRVGVYGRTADGSAATPTVYAQLGIIQRGADPNADPSTKPTLPVWAQIQAQIGDLSNLTTEDKTNLVAAINEAAKSGGGSGGGKDGTGKPSRGETGLQGPVGPVGPQGPRGEKGEDAAADRTLGLTGATVGQIAKIAAVGESGVPTAWSPVDMPSGGGSNWVKVYDGSNTITEEISVFEVDLTKSDPMKEFQLLLKLDKNTAADWGANKNINVTVNGETIGYFIFQHRLNTAVEFYEERNLEAMTAAKRCISPVSLTANVANSLWMVEQGVKQQNNGKLSIAFPAPYAGKITAKVFGRY